MIQISKLINNDALSELFAKFYNLVNTRLNMLSYSETDKEVYTWFLANLVKKVSKRTQKSAFGLFGAIFVRQSEFMYLVDKNGELGNALPR